MADTPRFERILVTNDDGIDAPGLAVAEALAASLGSEVWVVAPEHDQSGVGQAISLHQPLRHYSRGERRYALSGTPADCVMFALAHWFADAPPDLVISGVNCGANLSDAVMYSGTVGAVLAAAHLGVPAVALSQAFRVRDEIDWAPVQVLGERIIRRLVQRQPDHVCWNINFPALPAETIRAARVTRQIEGSVPRPVLKAGEDGRGLPYHWLEFRRAPDAVTHPQSDVVALAEGYVSVMPLQTSRCDEDRAQAGWQIGELQL